MKHLKIANYLFSIHSPEETFPMEGGVYIFACKSFNTFDTLYIGKTHCFFERLSSNKHEKWDAAIQMDLSHVLLHATDNEEERTKIERELIRKYPPYLNDQGQQSDSK